MSERINTPYTNEHFVAFCEKMLGMPYWYGTVVYKCTESLRARKAKQYPAHYGSGRAERYRNDIANKKVCADCVGLIKGYQWTGGGQGVLESIGTDKTFSSKYGSHNCPDKSANGMFSYAKSKGCAWGTIDTLPEVPGVALRFDGHVGVYIGGGYAIEERGFNYGCVKTRVSSHKWTHWYQLPFIDYGDAVFSGSDTNKALMEAVSDIDGGNDYAVSESSEKVDAPDKQSTTKRVCIVCDSGSVNIRVGNGTQYDRVTAAKNGASFEWVATAENGWHAIVVNGRVGWVSGKYSKTE